jgi:glycosyltransferase involved in cell wall biosynthesis
MAALESLSIGTPILLSDIPVHREITRSVPDYDLLFPVGERGHIAALLARVLSAPHRYKEMGSRARSAVQVHFTLQEYITRTESVLIRAAEKAAR